MFFQLIYIGLIFHSDNHVGSVFSGESNENSIYFTENSVEDLKYSTVDAMKGLGNGPCTGIIDEAIDILERVIECAGKQSCPKPPEAESSSTPMNCAGNLEKKTPEPESYFRPMDCSEILKDKPSSGSGVYTIWLHEGDFSPRFDVYCDMGDDGGGWTVIQKRGDFGSPPDLFYRNWTDYKNGFGDLNKDFWLGSDIIFTLTNHKKNSLKIDLEDWEGTKKFATFDEFWIDDEVRNYTLHVSGYHGTARDSFSYSNNTPFTTIDRDNDGWRGNCASTNAKGAWWHKLCTNTNLNGLYLKGDQGEGIQGVFWGSFRGYHYSLKYATMKIRPKLFERPGLVHK